MPPKPLTVLGSTGSIGVNTLDIAARFPQEFPIFALAAHSRVDDLARQIERHRPALAVLYDAQALESLKDRLPRSNGTALRSGMEGLLEAAQAPEAAHVVAGMVGAVGLRPAYAAIEAGKQISVANKETLVLAGELMMGKARETGASVLPMDSEHNAIFQCLQGAKRAQLARIILTASGGPFRDMPVAEFPAITKSQALKHPNWKMGPKITIDSATMMNKGLEVVEARWFFDTPPEQIEVVIHRQSIVHSLVEFIDGSVLAQLGRPDMRTPIAHCLAYPERLPLDLPRLSLVETGRLDFQPVEPEKFPCLQLALAALRLGGGAPAVLNGANEVVVAAYLNAAEGGFAFQDIGGTLQQVMQQFQQTLPRQESPKWLKSIHTVEDAIKADQWGRSAAAAILSPAAELAEE